MTVEIYRPEWSLRAIHRKKVSGGDPAKAIAKAASRIDGYEPEEGDVAAVRYRAIMRYSQGSWRNRSETEGAMH